MREQGTFLTTEQDRQIAPTKELRKPVLDAGSGERFRIPTIERQMGILTKIVAEEMKKDPAVREALQSFAGTPVSEELPQAFLTAMREAGNQRIEAYLSQEGENLVTFLELPTVPTELFQPDIINAPSYQSPGESSFRPEGRDGLTRAERSMVGSRYVMARYIKRLSLGAELLNHPELTSTAGRMETPSGIKIVFDTTKSADAAMLANPMNWETNRQLKDRVYEISTGGKKYILKERKTSTHQHLKAKGHVDGLTSEQEYATARFFETQGPTEEDDMRLRWEKPVGYVDFPDGYSFVVFEHEEIMLTIGEHGAGQNQAVDIFTRLIEETPEAYQEDFQALTEQVAQAMQSKSFLGTKLKLPFTLFSQPRLTFQEFARAKAIYNLKRLDQLREELEIKHGFRNNDHDGYGYRFFRGEGKEKPTIEQLGFDFEYMGFTVPPSERKQWLDLDRTRRAH